MAKTQAEYIEEQNRAAQAETEKRWKQREEQDAAYIAANNSAVDQSTAAALKPYETRMEQLPEEYRKQYDYNAVEELVRQKQVAETMANLGLTDSGLNRTQQTAIAVSRGNADAAARLSQQEKTQELQDKMDQLKATGEIQKQQTAAEVKANSQAWYNNLQSTAYENAANRGTALYDAEQQRLADAAALQKQLEWQKQEAAAAAAQQNFDNTMKMISAMAAAGATEEEILAYMRSAGLLKITSEETKTNTAKEKSSEASKRDSTSSTSNDGSNNKTSSRLPTQLDLKGFTSKSQNFVEDMKKRFKLLTGGKVGAFNIKDFVRQELTIAVNNNYFDSQDEVLYIMRCFDL